MRNKKAFEIQFNWIFILVAGAAILLFFTVVVAKQKGISDASTKAAALKSIDSIISGAGVSADTVTKAKIPNYNVEFGCGRISIGGVSKQYQGMVLFAPGVAKGGNLITQTIPFSAPYRATNLLFMTSDKLRYVLVGNSDIAKEINKSLPSDLKKEIYPSIPASFADSSNYRVRFISFGNMIDFPSALQKMPDSDVTAIKITGDSEKGSIEFFQKEGNAWASKGTMPYIGKASLMGAVYADSIGLYECNMQNVFSRLRIISNLYIQRTESLRSSMSGSQTQCNQFYSNALIQLNRIYASSLVFSTANIDVISDAAGLLSSENKNAQIYSCASIY